MANKARLMFLKIILFGILVVSLSFLAVSKSRVKAATVSAASCSLSAVQTAVNSAANGDTVNVPAGNCNWNGSRIDLDTKGLLILGAGAGNTIISNGGFTLTNSTTRVSGFTFNWSSNNYTLVVEGSIGWRFDHNTVTYPSASDMMLTYGQGGRPVEGLVDNNTITYGRILYYGDNTGETVGSNRWAEPLNIGTSHALYVEDNNISWPQASSGGYLNHMDGNFGCRYVARFNTILNGRFEAHTLQGDNSRGCRLWEIYNNTLTNNSDPSYRQFLIRAGTGVIFHNTTDGKALNEEIDLDNGRSFEVSIENQVTKFGMCGAVGTTPQPNGNSYVDGNTPGQYGYPCRDQIGRSTDAFQWGNTYPNPAPAQAFQPAYIWRNTNPSGELPTDLNCDGSGIPCSIQSTYHILESRDYYNYRSSFNGTAGVGEGTLAQRPSTCTTGVGYWATDQGEWNSSHAGADGELYTCSSTNTWSLYYEPYPHPFPLLASGLPNMAATSGTPPPPPPPPDSTPPSTPTNLSATAASFAQVNLSWTASTDNVGVTGYKVFRSGSQIGTANTNSYQDTTVSASSSYSYTVSAYDAAGNSSSQSASASVSTPAAPAQANVQSASNQDSATGTSIAKAFSSANTAGNLIVAAFSFDTSSGTAYTCSDSQGNSYSQATFLNDARHNQSLGICYAPNIKAGANTVTLSFGAASHPWRSLTIQEYKGFTTVSPLDKVAIGTGTSASAASTSVAPSQSNELIFGALSVNNGSPTVSAGNGFTLRQSVQTTSSEDQILASASSITANFSLSSSQDFAVAIATFKPASSSGTPVVGDLNLDHIVNSIDYSILNAHWFTSDATSDLNHDGLVNAIDYSLMNANWFKTW